MDIFDKIQTSSEEKIRISYLANLNKLPCIHKKTKYLTLDVDSKYLKNYSLDDKIAMAKSKIVEFLEKLPNEEIMISFSGGKDSCVLRDLVHIYRKSNGSSTFKIINRSRNVSPWNIKAY